MAKKKTSQDKTKKEVPQEEQIDLVDPIKESSKPTAGFSDNDLETIAKQVQDEIDFARKHRERRVEANWYKNEKLVYNEKEEAAAERANIGVANTKSFGFYDSLLSKIDNPPNIKFGKGEDADLKKAKLANSVLAQESKPSVGNWAMKDYMAKSEMILYGRAVFEFHASSSKGFKTYLTNTTVYDFLIDPAAGGLDIENALNLGRAGIYKDKASLEDGAKSGKYIKTAVDLIVEGKGGQEDSKEDKQKKNRYVALVQNCRIIRRDDQFSFWEWYTTYNGKRYYTLYNEKTKKIVRIVLLKEMFESNLWPFITFAAYPNLVEFWSPAPMDYVREIFMGQGVSINQMLDNSEAINHPMRAVNVAAIKNPASLKYGRDKIVKFNKGADLRKDLQTLNPAPIETPAKVYDILENIANTESGVNAATRGVAEEDKVGIYNGNLANVADRIGRLNKSYANAYHRLGLLFYNAIAEHMTQKTAVEVIGENGVQILEITKDDIIPKRRALNIQVDATDAELENDLQERKNKLTWLGSLKNDPAVNQKVRFEMEAKIFNATDDEVNRLLDVNEFADADLMSEASRDIQRIVLGETDVQPNEMANNKYMQKVIDYMRNNKEYMLEKPEIFAALTRYAEALRPIVTRNMVRKANEELAKVGKLDAFRSLSGASAGAPSNPQNPLAKNTASSVQ